MIDIIGYKRLVVLVALLLICGVFAGVSYGYLMPKNETLQADLKREQGKIRTKQAEAKKMREDFVTIQEKKDDFENLKLSGFFSNQDRLAFRRRISGVQEYADVLKASYDIGAAQIESNPGVEKAGHVVLKSDISVDIESMDDMDFYRFMYWVRNGFDGHTTITDMTLKRQTDVNDVTLRQIGSGTPLVLVKGKINFEWRTLVDESDISDSTLSPSRRR